MVDWQKILAIAVEAVFALIATFLSIYQSSKRKDVEKSNSAYLQVLSFIPRAILEAERKFGSGTGEAKLEYALSLIRFYCKSFDFDFDKYEQSIVNYIEDALLVPQKKILEVVNNEKNESIEK